MFRTQTFGEWTVDGQGISHPNGYEISPAELAPNSAREDWLDHMSAKRWVNLADFKRAYDYALVAFGISSIAAGG